MRAAFIEAGLTVDELTELCERMLAKSVVWQGPLDSPCRVWLGSVNNSGYGSIGLKGRHWLIHRIGFILGYGAPPKKQANHRCHVPRCWEPAHLYSGSQAQNVADAIAAGRARNRRERRTAQILHIKRWLEPMEQAVE
jgi:hypothetical protein